MLIKNDKIKKLLLDKDALVTTGRSLSQEIETVESRISELEETERQKTGEIEPKELIAEGEALKNEINTLVEKLQKVTKKIYQAKIKNVPETIIAEHQTLLKEKEKLERERNKIALKVQKIKDKVIPLIQKEAETKLGEYEDIEGVDLKGEEIEIRTYDRLEEFKARFVK